jgi:hypothetical protein
VRWEIRRVKALASSNIGKIQGKIALKCPIKQSVELGPISLQAIDESRMTNIKETLSEA